MYIYLYLSLYCSILYVFLCVGFLITAVGNRLVHVTCAHKPLCSRSDFVSVSCRWSIPLFLSLRPETVPLTRHQTGTASYLAGTSVKGV